ncbi:MAG: ribonuclease III [Magnetococcales bacterium]|nr:ribonuclease III [Magnetococcales bacterium]
MVWCDEHIGYRFRDPALLRLALTHRSTDHSDKPDMPLTASGAVQHNERLEFLGDAVLDLVISDALFHSRPDDDEGSLSAFRSGLVNTRALSHLAVGLDLGPRLRMGKGEEQSGGRNKTSILGNALEAVFGAIYLDGGYEAVSEVIFRLFKTRMDEEGPHPSRENRKSRLQEYLQSRGLPLPKYEVIATDGPPHARIFRVRCLVPDQEPVEGEGGSKRQAEQRAAGSLLQALEAGGAFDDQHP